MANIATMPATGPLKETRATELVAVEPEQLVARPAGMAGIERHPDWHLLSRLPMRLSAGVPLQGFRVKDLLGLKPGQLIASSWLSSEDVPLKVGAVQLCWSEFEVVEQRMAVRLTRLA